MIAFAVGIMLGAVAGVILVRLVTSRRVPGRAPDDGGAAAENATGVPRGEGSTTLGAEVGQLLGEAVNHLEIGVVVTSPAGDILYRNSAAQSFAGTHVGLLLDDHLVSILAATSGGDRIVRVVELHGPPRTWVEVAADPMPDGGAVATIRDVTELRRTDAMRTDFVTNISHELKTPVGAVAVLAEALIDESDGETIHRLADHLVDEAHRAVRTIDDLLRLSQIESTRPDESIVDLCAVVEEAVARGRVADGGRGVQITALDGPRPMLVRGDERQLASAVGNLVENAVKYSHTGDVVQVRTRVDATAVEVMVADQGIGIPARDLDRVFERFYRVDKARSRETGGTGLGLAIVRHVATNHGGEVLVSSQEGEGSTFVLRLPADRMAGGSVRHVGPDLPVLHPHEEESPPNE